MAEREVSVLRELRSVSAREGDGATFECTVSETEPTGRWELGGRALRPGGRVRIRQEGKKHILVLSELRTEDAGEVCFQAGPAQSLARLEVEALPLQMCRRPPREKTVLVNRRAVLEYEMRSHGVTHSLVIHDVRPEDQGTYSCQAGQDSADTQLRVEGEVTSGLKPTKQVPSDNLEEIVPYTERFWKKLYPYTGQVWEGGARGIR
ncbi:Obscurin-like protein 1 [Apodemus speciosus]|uniref:Obscurin-like protein 1 n=1 Tax=Apodemus speciosus TaxID=105296 RepID=A0ABQ0EEB8_APOSI